MDLRSLLPPLLVRATGALYPRMLAPNFHNWARPGSPSKHSYEADDLVEAMYRRQLAVNRELAESALAGSSLAIATAYDATALRTLLAVAVASNGKQQLSVLDFGGGCGTHYFTAKTFFGPTVDFRWHVVETEKTAARCRNLENGELRFYSSIWHAVDCMGPVDLVHSSGALHYLPDPLEALDELLKCGASHLSLIRFGLTSGTAAIEGEQRALLSEVGLLPGHADRIVSYPVTLLSRAVVEDRLAREHVTALRYIEPAGAFSSLGRSVGMFGYLCRVLQ